MSSGQEKPKGYVFGRPTKYKEEYCQQLIDHMEQGLSYESFAGVVSVSKQTIYDWEKSNPDFLDAKKTGTEKCRLFWEKTGIGGLWGSKEANFNSAVWIFNMKNRFRWADKVEVSGTEDAKPIMLAYKV